MYSNVGKTVKVIAVVVFILGIIGALLAGISTAAMTIKVLTDAGAICLGIAVTFLSAVLSYVGSVFIYAFGQLVDNSDKIRARVVKDPSVFSLE